MNVVQGYSLPIYLRLRDDGNYETVNPDTVPSGVTLYSLEQTSLNDDGNSKNSFYFNPTIIHSSNVIARRQEIISQAPVSNTISSISTYIIDGTPIDVTFSPTTNLDTIVDSINTSTKEVLGTEYENVADRYPDSSGNRIRLRSPQEENSSIIIFKDSVFETYLHLDSGEYYGDLPASYKSYVEDEPFVLLQESVTPNVGQRSNFFVPIINENGLYRFVSEFDKNLIEGNIRLKLLVDGFAYIIRRINSEISRFVDQIDLSKIDADNIEYVAYLFGIDLQSLTKGDDLISAREVLRSLMDIIHIKGTNEAFKVILKFLGLNARMLEYRLDDSQLDIDIDSSDLDAFYDRYLKMDSEFRNPILNYGSTVNDFTDLPSEGYDQEVIKVINEDGIFQYSLDNESWNQIFDDLSPIIGSGTEINNDLAWTYINNDRPYVNISADDYNELQRLGGFDLLPGNGYLYAIPLFDYDPDQSPMRGQITATQQSPFNLSSLSDRTLSILVDEEHLLNINFTDFLNQISDISAVTLSEIKKIIELNFEHVIVTNTPDNRIVLKSKRLGSRSSIRVLGANSKLGILLQFNRAAKQTKQLKISSGQLNTNNPGVAIPEVNNATAQYLSIFSESGNDADDGNYDIYINREGEAIVVSLIAFKDSIYDPSFGYVSKLFENNSAVKIGTLTYENGEITFVDQLNRQSDFSPNPSLTREQEIAILGFLRDKEAVAGRSTTISEGSLPTPISYYFRDGTRNTSQSDEPGIKNSVILTVAPISDKFILSQDIIDQSIKFIRYVRPVHIKLLSLLFESSPLEDSWPKVATRILDGDYQPGFWDGTNRVIESVDLYYTAAMSPYISGIAQFTVDGVNDTFTTRYPILNSVGETTSYSSDITVISDGVILPDTDYTVSGSTVIITNALSIPSTKLAIIYHSTDGKFDWELDIAEDFVPAYFFGGIGGHDESAWYTTGDQFIFSDPVSGENQVPEFTPKNRYNTLLKNVRFTEISTGYGTADYQDWVDYGELLITNELTQNVSVGTNFNRVIVDILSSTQPVAGSTITFTKTDPGANFASTALPSTTYTFSAVPGVKLVLIGATIQDTIYNLMSEINAEDSTDLSASFISRDFSPGDPPYPPFHYKDNTLEILDTPGDGIQVSSTIAFSCGLQVYSEYTPLKKSVINDVNIGAIVGKPIEDQSTAVSTNKIQDPAGAGVEDVLNASIPYYSTSGYMHRGHTNGSLTALDSETYLNNFYFRGIENGAIGGDWTDGGSYNLSSIRNGTPYFHGSENYDGGASSELSLTDYHYTDPLDPDNTSNRFYRNRGMYDGGALQVYLKFMSGPFTEKSVVLLMGNDITDGTALGSVGDTGTVIDNAYNGGSPTNDLNITVL